MKKTKIKFKKQMIFFAIVITLLILITIDVATANAAIIASAMAARSDDTGPERTAGCTPPMDFAKEHNCELTYYGTRSVNTFFCQGWKVVGDCEGGVISATDERPMLQEQNKKFMYFISIIGLLFVIILLIIYLIYRHKMRKLKKELKNIHY